MKTSKNLVDLENIWAYILPFFFTFTSSVTSMSSGINRGVYRLAKVDICTILVHIPMLEGKSSMVTFFSNCSDEISPLNQPFENSYFFIIGQHFKVL